SAIFRHVRGVKCFLLRLQTCYLSLSPDIAISSNIETLSVKKAWEDTYHVNGEIIAPHQGSINFNITKSMTPGTPKKPTMRAVNGLMASVKPK
ncbi:MAG: hypothetical protein PWP48_1857, partial [Clostridiales bacterium]|nr:hypothetical protein [Clostridiales bacterium]